MPHQLDITHRLHRRMLEIVGTGLPLIASSIRDSDLGGLAHLREEMVEVIELYCRHVHRLREAAVTAADTARAADADALVTGCADLRAAYEAFRERWADRPAAAHWHEYRLSAVVMMKKIRGTVEDAGDRAAARPLAA